METTSPQFWMVCLLVAFLATPPSRAAPLEKAVTRHEEIRIEGRATQDEPSHLLQMEHREEAASGLDDVMNKVLSSRTASAVDKLASNVVQLAGGVVYDLGDLFVDTIDQLPEAIRLVSDAVGKAVDSKRKKVLLIVKEEKLEDPVNLAIQATERLGSAVQNSEFQSSLTKLEDAFASFLGKFIGVTYKNAEGIGSAFSHGIRRITDPKDNENNLPLLSRSFKENEISNKAESEGQ